MTDKENKPDEFGGQNGGYSNRKTDPPYMKMFATIEYGLRGIALKSKFMQNAIVKRRMKSPDTSSNPPTNRLEMMFGALGLMTIGASLRYSKYEIESYCCH